MNEYSYTIARHHSMKNEPDLLQEEMVSDDSMTPPSSPLTQKSCFDLLGKVCYDNPLPRECLDYQDVKVALQRKNTNRDNHAIAFQGMSPGEAAAARVAREHGRLHHAQIQRRMTSERKNKNWW
ncbi:hypothetical protein FisN_15Lh317 [Fistulifera solaris]|uniref:Uncharacterized protein n=1 Tax=Fistulifera solaris TaxID=1519565 RepID=A0A1Z5JX48_FISSO|nr:hypothetical protein FisN_15Lh317 [Fistulifera solaris]|eukprot:GAX18388.1 hypothetical protein FisN_15Lh317 [Fistulifera solaris]